MPTLHLGPPTLPHHPPVNMTLPTSPSCKSKRSQHGGSSTPTRSSPPQKRNWDHPEAGPLIPWIGTGTHVQEHGHSPLPPHAVRRGRGRGPGRGRAGRGRGGGRGPGRGRGGDQEKLKGARAQGGNEETSFRCRSGARKCIISERKSINDRQTSEKDEDENERGRRDGPCGGCGDRGGVTDKTRVKKAKREEEEEEEEEEGRREGKGRMKDRGVEVENHKG
eukprot:767284-Hanusia_phi.AAC.6